MLPLPAGREASADDSALQYAWHRPERPLPDRPVKKYYPRDRDPSCGPEGEVPGYVQQTFKTYR